LIQNGESLKFVQQQLGHSTIAMTVDLYGKWLEAEPVRGGANYLDAMTRPPTDSTLVANRLYGRAKPHQSWLFREGLTVAPVLRPGRLAGSLG
jgi:hypothetical protein